MALVAVHLNRVSHGRNHPGAAVGVDVVWRTRQSLDLAWSRRFAASNGGVSPRSDQRSLLDVVLGDRGFS